MVNKKTIYIESKSQDLSSIRYQIHAVMYTYWISSITSSKLSLI